MSRFVRVDRETAYLLPPSVQEWLPKDHLARYVVDVAEVEQLLRLAEAADASERPEAEGALPIAPLIAMGRERHHVDLIQRFGPEPLGPAPQDPLAAMAHRLRTHEGGALYALLIT